MRSSGLWFLIKPFNFGVEKLTQIPTKSCQSLMLFQKYAHEDITLAYFSSSSSDPLFVLVIGD